MKRKVIGVRNGRSYMLVENSQFECGDNHDTGVLKVRN